MPYTCKLKFFKFTGSMIIIWSQDIEILDFLLLHFMYISDYIMLWNLILELNFSLSDFVNKEFSFWN